MAYADYNGFDQTYFEGGHEAGYSEYRRGLLPFNRYSELIKDKLLDNGINPSGEKVLIIGCAYGYTVEYLVDDWSIDAYGMDISTWAVSQSSEEISYGDRISQGDVLSSSDIKNATPGGKPSVIISEALLSCLTDSEAQTATTNMRSECQNFAVHRVWSTDGSDLNTNWYNAKTLSEWQSLCDPNGEDYWFTEREFQP